MIIGTTAGTIKGVRLGRVNVYVGGVLNPRLGLVLKSDGLYLGGSQRATVITIR